MSYRLHFHAYCGMSWRIADGLDKDEAKRRVRLRNRIARKSGKPVAYLGREGNCLRWEHETPEDAFMVSDDDGILVLEKVRSA